MNHSEWTRFAKSAPVNAWIDTHATLLIHVVTLMFNITFVRYESSKRSIHILCWKVPSIWQLQSNNRFLTRNISHTKRFSDSREKRDTAHEKCLERNETRIARNKTRGGNLLLSGTVCFLCLYLQMLWSIENKQQWHAMQTAECLECLL